MSNIVISIIIITRDRPKLLHKSINKVKSVIESRNDTEIIIIDSSSNISADIVTLVSQYYHIKNAKGNNMPYARNFGIKRSKGDILVFIDDDAFPRNNWLYNLLLPYQDHSVGGVGGRVIENNEFYYYPINPEDVGRISYKGQFFSNFNYNGIVPFSVHGVKGCNMSFRRSVLQQIGGFDERIRGYNEREETDICMRVKSLGFNIIFHPKAIVDHKCTSRINYSREINGKLIYNSAKNSAYVIFKNRRFSIKLMWLHIYSLLPEKYKYFAYNYRNKEKYTPLSIVIGTIFLIIHWIAANVGVIVGLFAKINNTNYLTR